MRDQPNQKQSTTPAQPAKASERALTDAVTSLVDSVVTSTAKILIELYKSAQAQKGVKIDADDATLKRCVVLDAKMSQAYNLLTKPDNLAESQERMASALSQINDAAKGRTQQAAVMADAYNMYKRQYDELVTRTSSFGGNKDKIMQNYRSFLNRQNEAVVALLERRGGNITIEELQQELTKFEKEVVRFVKEQSLLEYDFSQAADRVKKATPTQISAPGQAPTPNIPGNV